MKTNIAIKGSIIAVLIVSLLFSTCNYSMVFADSSKSVSKTGSYKKSIKSYNKKTQKIAKNTPAASKLAKKTKSYYKKSKKTKKVKTLKSLKSKSKKAFKSAQVLDYRRQIKDVGKQIKDVSYLAPSMDSYVTKSTTINSNAKKCTSLSTLKRYLSEMKTLNKNAKTHKATLSWYDAEYRRDWIEGHYKTVIIQPAEYDYFIVSYYVAVASNAGYKTGSTFGWDLETCKANGAIFPYSENKDEMKSWGCIYYSKDNGTTIQRIIPSSELRDYSYNLVMNGISSQSRETGEWFLIQEEISEERWIPGYYKDTLIKKAGWY